MNNFTFSLDIPMSFYIIIIAIETKLINKLNQVTNKIELNATATHRNT